MNTSILLFIIKIHSVTHSNLRIHILGHTFSYSLMFIVVVTWNITGIYRRLLQRNPPRWIVVLPYRVVSHHCVWLGVTMVIDDITTSQVPRPP